MRSSAMPCATMYAFTEAARSWDSFRFFSALPLLDVCSEISRRRSEYSFITFTASFSSLNEDFWMSAEFALKLIPLMTPVNFFTAAGRGLEAVPVLGLGRALVGGVGAAVAVGVARQRGRGRRRGALLAAEAVV